MSQLSTRMGNYLKTVGSDSFFLPNPSITNVIWQKFNFKLSIMGLNGGLISWGCRIHWLHHFRGVRLPQRVSWICYKTVWWWGSRNAGGLRNAECPFFSTSPRSTLARSGSTMCQIELIGFTLLYLKMAVMPLVPETKMADVGKPNSFGNLLIRKVVVVCTNHASYNYNHYNMSVKVGVTFTKMTGFQI